MVYKIWKKIDSSQFNNEIELILLYAIKPSLELFSTAGSSQDSSDTSKFSAPDPDTADEYLRDLALPLGQILSQKFFAMMLFPITIWQMPLRFTDSEKLRTNLYKSSLCCQWMRRINDKYFMSDLAYFLRVSLNFATELSKKTSLIVDHLGFFQMVVMNAIVQVSKKHMK